MPDEKLVLIDIDIMHWTVFETRLYRTAVGVNPEYAMGALKKAAEDSSAAIAAEFGDAEPPDDYMPMALLNVDPGYLLGFAWMAARRADKTLTFDDYAETIETGALMQAFYGASAEAAEEEAPLAEPPAKARKTSSPPKAALPSASSTAGA